MTKAERLSAVAAHAANPDDDETGRKQVDATAAKLVLRWRLFLIARTSVGALSFPIAIGLAVRHPEWFQPIVIVAGIIIFVSIFSGHYVQTRKRFFVGQPYDAELPAGVEHLLAELAAGRIEARLSKEDGLASPGALRTPDGALLDRIIGRRVFARRYAPILLSSTANSYDDFWMPWGERLNSAIYVIIPEGPEQAESDTSLDKQREVHWITKIPRERFSDWKSDVQQRGPWDGYTQIEVGQVLADARRKAESDALAEKKFSVNGFARRAKTPRLSAETIRKLIAWSGDHDYDWVRKSAEAASTGSDQVG